MLFTNKKTMKITDVTVAGLASVVSYVFGVEYAAILPTLLLLVFADHLTGIAKSVKNKVPITSYGLKRFVVKMATYCGALIGIYHVSTLVTGDLKAAVDIMANLMPYYIGMIEFKSILENVSEAGFKVPGAKKLDNILSLK